MVGSCSLVRADMTRQVLEGTAVETIATTLKVWDVRKYGGQANPRFGGGR